MKTSELTGAALDWAVAKCEGVRCGVITPAGVLARRAQSTDNNYDLWEYVDPVNSIRVDFPAPDAE